MIKRLLTPLLATVALCLTMCAVPAQAQNYVARDGNGTLITFCAGLAGGLLYPCHQVQGKDAIGAAPTVPPVYVGGIGSDGFMHALKTDTSGDLSVTLPAGAATTGGFELELGGNAAATATSAATTATDIGAPGSTACATDTGSCALNAQMQRLAQRITSLITLMGSPAQTSGYVYPQVTVVGGCTPYGYQAAASTNSTLVSTGVHTFCGGKAYNTTGTLYYLRFYDMATAPTCSSATGFIATIPIPASVSGAGTDLSFGTYGLAFSNGVSWCITGGPTSTDNTSAAVGVFVAVGYK